MKLTYCAQQIRQYDPDRFLLSIVCSKEHWEALWALFAFNCEISKIRSIVEEPMMGLVRLQWWRDTIRKIEEGQKGEGDIAQNLGHAIQSYQLPCEYFENLLIARELDCYKEPFADLKDFINYAKQTHLPLNRLALHILGEEDRAKVIEDISLSFALVSLLRADHQYKRTGRSLIPNSFKDHKGAAQEILHDKSVYYSSDSRYLRAVQHLTKLYRQQIQSVGYDIYHEKLLKPPAFKELRVWSQSVA